MNNNMIFFAKKFKLTNEQATMYAWLKDQNINTDDGTLCYWVKTYSPKRIKEVIEFANARRKTGQEIINIGGWINKFLKSGNAVVNDTCLYNHRYATDFVRANNWKELRIYEKYVKDEITEDDLPLTMAIDDFIRSLERLYQKSQLYR